MCSHPSLIQAVRRLLGGAAAVLLLANTAFAGELVPLNDKQLDSVSAGLAVFLFYVHETDINNTGTVTVNVDPVNCACFVNIQSEPFTLQAQFGPSSGSNSFVFVTP
ncbi:MAG TPA: hypothetical protein VLX09_14215 [Stellaceae bacterium]|nr:hypothetical protein [Stellaceae bacterium]